jgi:hypothetical protein
MYDKNALQNMGDIYFLVNSSPHPLSNIRGYKRVYKLKHGM